MQTRSPVRNDKFDTILLSPGSDFEKIAQLCRRHIRGLGEPQQAQKSPFSDFQENGFFVFVYTDAQLAGIVKLQSTVEVPSLQAKTICPRFERYRLLRQFRYCFFDFFPV